MLLYNTISSPADYTELQQDIGLIYGWLEFDDLQCLQMKMHVGSTKMKYNLLTY